MALLLEALGNASMPMERFTREDLLKHIREKLRMGNFISLMEIYTRVLGSKINARAEGACIFMTVENLKVYSKMMRSMMENSKIKTITYS